MGTDVAPGTTASFGSIIADANNYAMITTPFRNIGGIFPHVTIEEIHRDEMFITQHPVETGAPVTDHAFMQPSSIEIRCGFSNSNAQSEGYVQLVYQKLLALQKSGQPFNVTTGKRPYTSMLMRSLLVRTNIDFEFALMVVAVCQQVIIVSTQTTGASSPNSNGSSQIGTIDPNGSGQFTPDGGASPVDAGNTIGPPPAGSNPENPYNFPSGSVGFSNAPFDQGTQNLITAPSTAPAAPSVEQAAAIPVPSLPQ